MTRDAAGGVVVRAQTLFRSEFFKHQIPASQERVKSRLIESLHRVPDGACGIGLTAERIRRQILTTESKRGIWRGAVLKQVDESIDGVC